MTERILLQIPDSLVRILHHHFPRSARLMMTKFGKCTKPFSSNKVVSKTVSTWIVVSTRQLAKLIKTINKDINWEYYESLI
jgi:hypothetical protein